MRPEPLAHFRQDSECHAAVPRNASALLQSSPRASSPPLGNRDDACIVDQHVYRAEAIADGTLHFVNLSFICYIAWNRGTSAPRAASSARARSNEAASREQMPNVLLSTPAGAP